VTAVDRAANTVTLSGNLDTVDSITDDDYVFRRGDYAAAFTGIAGWGPIADPGGSDNFMGVNRSTTDVQRVSGLRYTGTGTKEESLINACAEGAINGIMVTTCFCNPLDYASIIIELGSKRIRDNDGDGKVGFKSVEVDAGAGTESGTINVIADKDIKKGYAWLVNTEDFEVATAGGCPDLLNHGAGGGMFRTMESSDALQGRLGTYGNLFNNNPGNQIILTWP
jgi:hypothetical protein